MRVVAIGGGPAGLYLGILLRKADPSHEVVVLERNRPDATYGFGVVFSDATLENLAAADRESYEAIVERFHHWDDIDVHYGGEVLSSTGHGFAGIERRELLEILAARAEDLGVVLEFGEEVADPASLLEGADLLVGADGVNSAVRRAWEGTFEPAIDWRPNRYVWLGTTRPFPAFKFYFKWDENGLWRVHAYRYSDGLSTFIVETTEEALASAGLGSGSEEETLAFCEALFADELEGHRLVPNRSVWRSFPTLTCERWRRGRVVLIGDAAHTAHFSVGSGTKMAMEDAIALVRALGAHADVEAALAAYEEERRPEVESLQRAAKASLMWFEGTERYWGTEPIQFAFNLLTRSLRITHEDLRVRDPAFTRRIDRWFAEKAIEQSGVGVPLDPPPPPLFTPFRLRDLLLENRVVVSAMCQYSAEDGTPNEWHFVHLGSRAVGGAGLVMAEMTDVSREARISPGCAGLYREETHVPAWRRITDFVHQHSYAKIGIQLGHAGRKGATRLAWEGMDEPLEEGAWEIVAPSPIPYFPHSRVPRPMTRDDMDAVVDDFVRATGMAEEAGFDLLEVHLAHGYLLASFVSPLTNRRDDEYGGSLENRLRFPLEVVDAVRAAWPEKPLSVRISAVDWVPGGQEIEDSLEVARALKEHGVDIVDVSAGQTVPHAKPEYGRQFQTPFSDRIRHEVGVPTMAVGNISSYMDVNTILEAGRADLCAMARAHLWDPYWTRNAAWRLGHPLPWPDPYSTLDDYTPRFE